MALQGHNGAEKLRHVSELMSFLEKDLNEGNLTTEQRVQTLLQLRQYGTQPQNADPIYSRNGMETLAKYGVEGESADIRRAALRCIANAVLLDEKMRQTFVDTGYGGKIAENLKSDNSEDEMVASRILFVSTYDTTMSFEDLINEHFLGDNINYQVSRHSEQFPEPGIRRMSQIDEMAFTDTLKLIFNISKLKPNLATTFSPSIPHIFKIISHIHVPPRSLDGLIGYMTNSLSTQDLEGEKQKNPDSFFPPANQNCIVDKLIYILNRALSAYRPEELELKAIPLIHALITFYELAPDGPREHMQWLLLPQDSDRNLPIGYSDTLSSRLLNASTTPHAKLKTAISELTFVLSGKDAETLTKNIGFGYASGFFASRGMQFPQATRESSSRESMNFDPAINPVTGQRWSAERRDVDPPMTKEEKEREAERLFVLFERARENGFLGVENPVAQAAQAGRFQEISDSSDSD